MTTVALSRVVSPPPGVVVAAVKVVQNCRAAGDGDVSAAGDAADILVFTAIAPSLNTAGDFGFDYSSVGNSEFHSVIFHAIGNFDSATGIIALRDPSAGNDTGGAIA